MLSITFPLLALALGYAYGVRATTGARAALARNFLVTALLAAFVLSGLAINARFSALPPALALGLLLGGVLCPIAWLLGQTAPILSRLKRQQHASAPPRTTSTLGQNQTETLPAKRRRLSLSFLLSTLLHALVLSLTFSGQGLGLFPGFALPWQQRWIEAPNLNVVLRPARQVAAPPAAPAPTEQKTLARPARKPSASFASDLRRDAEPVAPKADAPASALAAPAPAEESRRAANKPTPRAAIIALEQSEDKTFVVPPPPPKPDSGAAASPVQEILAPAPADASEPTPPSERETPEPAPKAAEADPAEQEAQRLAEAARLAAEKQAARQDAERREAERLAAEKLAAQQRENAQREAARAEAARQDAERREAERLAAEKLAAQQREDAQREAARAEAARQDAERLRAAQEEEEKRLERRRAMGRQLNEEAAQRQAAANLPLSLSTARRARLWGRSDPNAALIQYAEAWIRKIQLNTPVDTVRQLAALRHTPPMVAVALRSDGSVESVTIVISSGVAEVDDAIRRIVQSNVPYPGFPPALARQYDVVEIRRTWHFDNAVRLD